MGPDSRFPIPDSRFPIPDSRFPIPDSRFPISYLQSKKPTLKAPRPRSKLFPCSLLNTSDDLDYYTDTKTLECHL
ncbi:hypothetical protein [Moorena producens]|uniref:hypothetical protein n=1 Tax=Moorena producens TaxID=1155739 RepID=UPI003C78CD8B